MTNEYGSDSQPQEQEHEQHDATHEPAAHEGDLGVWTDDQPPHDDFESAHEETATVSQEAATESEHEETAVPEQRQSRSMLPILAGLGGIVILGAVLYLQFGHSSSSAPPMRLASSATQKSAELPPTSPAPPTTTSTTTNSAETDIGSLYKPAGTPAPVTMPPSSTAIETTPSPLPPSKSETAAIPPTPVTPPVSSATTSETTPKLPSSAATTNSNAKAPILPQANPTNPVPPMPGQVLNPPPVIMPATNEHADAQQMSRLNSLAARIDTLQKSLDQMTNMVTAMPGTAKNNANPDVENRLNRIEQTLTKIENGQAAKATKQTASVSSPESYETPARVAHTTKTSSSRHKHHTRPAPVSHHRAISTASASTPIASHSPWVLRAATPKEAWVSTDATSPDLRHVQIGESLSGIGTVRSIRQVNGGWEIEGSTGVIR